MIITLFSTKLRIVIEKYNLKDYIECFNKKREAYVGYAFTEEEANMLALLLACSTTMYTTKKEKYNCEVLSPISKSKKAASRGISDLLRYMENFKNYTLKHYLFGLNRSELSYIFYIIEFAAELSKLLSRMIISIFNKQNYTEQAFKRIISKLHDFIQEINLFDALCEECDTYLQYDIFNAYEEISKSNRAIQDKYRELYIKYKPHYHSIDVSVADAMSDVFLDKLSIEAMFDAFYRPIELNSKKWNYIKSLKNRVVLMIEAYYELRTSELSDQKWKQKFRDEFCHEFGVSPYITSDNDCSIETLIFEMYINPGINRVISNEISLEEFYDEILKKIDKLFQKKDKELAKSEESEYFKAILKQVDLLLLKPFQKLHEDDMKELEKRIKDNRPLSTECYYSQIPQ